MRPVRLPPLSPVIRSVFPNPALVGQSIRIFGSDLGTAKGTLTIGGQSASITMWTPYFVEAVVPPPSPVIRAVYPNPAKPGSIVSVSGINFGTMPGTVMLGTTSLTIRSWSPYFVSVELPNSLTTGTYTLQMTMRDGQTTTAKITIS
ncbi:MAG: hypothetical protein C7B43_04710 [Sulfobacillus benefaciens]|uniref:IPT/TIG domain-containing protein n=1 Tax=Sulfobacillus benefaciens TaxID=453960 RepID=A0A2T2X8J9_9FIRM|nr:MAG: hypothetical protein C7B43_04710 [Sulfobacillus benefaciens]